MMITLIYPYYENGRMLERHFAEWSRYAPDVRDKFRVIVVDDGSPTDPAAAHMPLDRPFPVELYRIKQNIPWNVPGARNLGMTKAPNGWCLLTDIDHLLEAPYARRLVISLQVLAVQHYYTFHRRWADGRRLHPHPNSYLLQRSLYWAAGGTDEDWSGWWGAGENAFRRALRQTAGSPLELDICLTHFGRDDIKDASTREWGRRGSAYDWAKNTALVKKHRHGPYRAENPLRFEWEKIET